MKHAHSRPSSWTATTVRAVTVLAIVLMAAGSLLLAFERTAAAATPTYSGAATIADGSSDTTELSGGSASLFTFNLPAQAACPGDTTTGGYLVDSYLVPQSTPLSSLTFSGGIPSAGFALYNSANNKAWVAQNTDTGTGQIIGIPDTFEFGAQVGHSKPTVTNLLANSGVWEVGIACELSGALTNYWNTEVTFSASTSDPGGFIWTQVPGNQTTPTTTTTTEPTTTTTTTTEPTTTTTTSSTTTTTEPSTTTTEPSTTTTTTSEPTTTTTTTEPSTTTTEPPTTTTTTTEPTTTTTSSHHHDNRTFDNHDRSVQHHHDRSVHDNDDPTVHDNHQHHRALHVEHHLHHRGGGVLGRVRWDGYRFIRHRGHVRLRGNRFGIVDDELGELGTLAFTGFPVGKGIGLGLLAVGVGLVLLAWEPRVRARLVTAHRDGPR